ncbi:MAG: hypothetical protein JWR69_333 [Pedosphaera sp.]|nr:hypothetical protein [Pedosphaera sp.]
MDTPPPLDCYAQINEKIGPIERGDVYEDRIDTSPFILKVD